VVFCLLLLFAAPARPWADTGGRDWLLCGEGLQLPARPAVEESVEDPEETHVSADEAELIAEGTSTLRGNVHILRGPRQVLADKVLYDEPSASMDAQGKVRLWDEGVYLTGDRARMNMVADEAILNESSFTLLDSHARGEAKKIIVTGSDLLHVEGARYTTCNPGQEDWLLEADEINLNRATDVGTARNVVVKFMDTPVFYSPYLTFPLSDKRKTGFLLPSYGNSRDRGFEITVPYYWNIAPYMDATVSARGMSKRGVMAGGEFRYLTRRGGGELGVEYLPDDDKFGDDRAAFSFHHSGSFAPYWSTEVSLNHVTDKQYFEDLGTDLAIASTRHLERRLDLNYARGDWSATGRVHTYQTIDKTIEAIDRPYKRLPQIRVSKTLRERNRQLNLGFQSEFVHFDRSSGVTGTRLDLRPTVSFPLRTASTFVIPRVSVRHTRYDLDNNPAGITSGRDRTIPTFSLDSGLFLERNLSFKGKEYVHTLEPRLFYLAIPYEGQDDLPVFDTGSYTFSFAQLFRDDRFSGADRVGDAHQLTAALTTRVMEPGSGDELLRASVGQIRHFRNRRVTLPGEPRESRRSSDLVAEIAGKFAGAWRGTAGMQWNTREERTDRGTVAVRYQPDARRVVNASYRFVRGAVEQTDLSFSWPFANQWNAVGRYNHSLRANKMLEGFLGFEYDSCCWAIRAVGRRYLTNTDGDFSNALFLQLELKGLTGIGRKTGEFLRQSIPGYHSEL
jgi:LPS-assembly protein